MNIGRCGLVALIITLSYSIGSAQLTYQQVQVMYDSPWTYKNLQMIPVKFKPKGEGTIKEQTQIPHTISFAEAMQKHKIKVQEMQYEYGADVNLLQVTNHSRQNIVVQSGEILEGGKQDRMVGETKYIAPGTTDYVPVYCVEKQRWSPKPKDFRLRGIANREVQKAMNLNKRQSAVWKEIDRQYKAENKTSETWSYLELYNNAAPADTGYINFFTRKYVESDSNIAGFIFITGDHIMSTEAFSGYSLMDITFANMLSSYVQSVIMHGLPPTMPVEAMKPFMNKVFASEEEQKKYVPAHGVLHKHDEKVIHLVAYPD